MFLSLCLLLSFIFSPSCARKDAVKEVNHRGNLLLFEAVDLNSSETLSFHSLLDEGRTVLLNFWGIRCTPCIEEIKELNGLYQGEFEGKMVELIAVNTDGLGAKELKKKMREFGIDIRFPVVADPDFVITNYYSNGFVPHSVVITPDGGRFEITGYNPELFKTLEKKLLEVAGER